ncbi:MAG: TonB-dependent receptor [Pseudomonadota bacterium]
MSGMKRGGIAARCGASIILSAFCGEAAASGGEGALAFDEIIVTGERSDEDTSVIAPDAASLLATPGDINDPLKALQSLPGVTFGGGDLDDPVIRGGGPGDNLFIVDGAPVENLFHELSDSIISPNVIRTFDLQSTAFSAEYGDAVGGVIDIGLRDPHATERRLAVDLSQFKSGALIETPLSDTISVYGAYRHNLAHLFLEEFERGKDVLVFQMPQASDYTARAIWRGRGVDVTATAFGSWDRTEETPRDEALSDVLGEVEKRRLDAQSLRVRVQPSSATDVTTTLSHSVVTDKRREANGSFVERDATTVAFRGKVSHRRGRHFLEAGVNHTYTENDLSFLGFIPLPDRLEQRRSGAFAAAPARLRDTFHVTEAFISDSMSITDRFTIDLGVHAAFDYFLDESFVEPRIGVTYAARDDIDLYARFGRHHLSPDKQELAVLGAVAGLQESERSTQALAGARWELADGWRLQPEAWFKNFERDEFIGTALERRLTGDAYGLDVLLAKPIGERLYGWLALSVSDSEIAAPGAGLSVVNQFAPPVSATVAASYAFDGGWKIGAKYRAQSGDAFTPLLGVTRDPVSGAPRPQFGEPFSGRLRAYHRLDVRVEKRARYSFADVLYYVDILNVTDRENVANRDYPLRNTVFAPGNFASGAAGSATILPDDEEGIPFFIAFGVNFEF